MSRFSPRWTTPTDAGPRPPPIDRGGNTGGGSAYFRRSGDIWLPHVFLRSVGDFGPPHGAVIEQVVINPDLPDSLFHAPGGGGY